MDGDRWAIFIGVLMIVLVIGIGIGYHIRRGEIEEVKKIQDIEDLRILLVQDVKDQIKRMTVYDFQTWLNKKNK